MENTTALDSNSESDISDSWALIDEDSSLEWNNEMGLSTRNCVLEKNEVPRSSSRSELSDEDSIEVVDDHTDCLSDNEAEELKDTQQLVGLSENLNVLPEVGENKDVPVIKMPNVKNATDNSIMIAQYKSTLVIIVLFLVGIVGGIAAGYSLACYHETSENFASIQDTRALLANLQNEKLLLQNHLRIAHSSLRKAIGNLPGFEETSVLTFHKEPLKSSVSKPIDYAGLCKITDFLLQSRFNSNNISSDVCLATDKPWEDDGNLFVNKNKITLASTDLHKIASENIAVIPNTSANKVKQIPKGELHSLQTDKTPIHIESSSTLSDESFNEHLYQKNAPQHNQDFENKFSNTDAKSNDIGTDPRPFTEARSIVEKMYTMLSVLGDDFQNSLPSKSELLSILRLDGIDFPVDTLKSIDHKNIIDFKNQMKVTTQKMLNGVQSSINRFIKNVASKLKKFERDNIKQICKLKRTLENSSDKNHVDLSKPIFQKCVDYWQNGHNKAQQKNSQAKVTDFLQEKKDSMGNDRATFDHKKVNHMNHIEQNKLYGHDTYHPNENNQEMHENVQFSGEKTKKTNNKLPTLEKNTSDMDKLKKYDDDDAQKKGNYHRHKQNMQPDQQKKRWKEEKQDEIDNRDSSRNRNDKTYDKKRKVGENEKNVNKMTNDFNRKHEKYSKKTFDEKEKKIENKDYKKQKDKKIIHEDETNMSGEWMQKMAHGRAEQRRREHESDWVFDRAESRKSSRKGERRNTYWYEAHDYSGTVLNSDMCNKTRVFKDKASKAWKDIKHHVKENVLRPIVDTAKTAKRVLNNFNYRSHRE